jgi:hypothetical protein
MNRGDGFENLAAQTGITDDSDGRAVAAIDFDDNGSVDVLLTTQNGPPRLYRNDVEPEKRWIGFSLIGTRSNRDAVGARVEIRQGDKRWYRWATGGKTGYLAGSDPRVHFGIPDAGRVDVTVVWPSGHTDVRTALETGGYYTIREGASP